MSPPIQQGLRPAAAAHLLASACALALVAVAQGYDLDPCQVKPTYNASRCEFGSAVACWSLDASTSWRCWTADWAPSWALLERSSEADAACIALATPAGSGLAAYDGACTLAPPTQALAERLAGWSPKPWAEAKAKARETIKQMNGTEKNMLMRGVGWEKTPSFWDLKRWWYVGGTRAIPRLGIPSLNLQDAAGGFRTYWTELVGTVTCWPSLLCMAATWDPTSVQAFAVALGREFAGKGANGILGPSINVHRVARNGRNFEYLSGEDPYLGAQLARAYVKGVQSQGIIAVMKHWIFNEQETNRDSESSNVDAQTAWELYYPPFEAAVDAGVAAAMCSYNKVNGHYSCQNHHELETVLKGEMGFQGFVQSDWWATHTTSISQGLDQDMPGTDPLFTKGNVTAAASPKAIDESCERILGAIYRSELEKTTKCSPPNCEEWYKKNVTSAEHVALARTLAAESIVLLKNAGGLLPLPSESNMTIAIVGAVANGSVWNPAGDGQGVADAWRIGDYYSGGGSGHVVAGFHISARRGITARAEAAGMTVVNSLSDDPAEGASVAAGADVAIVVGGAIAGEAGDRKNLNLDGSADALIEAVAKVNKNTVVLMQIPGAVVMPWRDSTRSILAMFLGGQETGNAWASVLFGDHAPTGRLPIMMPATESDTIQPGGESQVPYAERLATSYRNTNFKAAFPFGHGLTYTTFEYSEPKPFPCITEHVQCINVTVRNTGKRPGKTVAQLYLEFPPAANHPAPFLKGFQKTPVLMPGSSAEVTFSLTDRDLSYYDDGQDSWVKTNSAVAHIGESSADLRQVVRLYDRSNMSLVVPVLLGCLLLLMCITCVAIVLRDANKDLKGGSRELLEDEGLEENESDSEYTE